MIFSEIYGYYFKSVSAILDRAVRGELTGNILSDIVQDSAFSESVLVIPSKLSSGDWPLLDSDYGTPLYFSPSMPLTSLEKQWLKAVLQDPRVQLFGLSDEGLEDTEPLFSPEDFVYFDRYNTGDPFSCENYIRNFRLVLQAIKEKRRISVTFESGRGTRQKRILLPQALEYSSKDDRFRAKCATPGGHRQTVNLGRLITVELLEPVPDADFSGLFSARETVTAELTDERNALERCMLHFTDLEKETEKIDEHHYRVTLHYDSEDKTEILIRILSFGPLLKVTEPEDFIRLIRERLIRQKNINE